MIVDEGFTGVDQEYGRTFARVGLGEKGCFTVRLSISTPGGHSSRPPPHTAIGIAGLMFSAMEKSPGPIRLESTNPLLGYLECAATHGEMDETTKSMVRCPKCWPKLAEQLSKDGSLEVFLRTTQAITVVDGGIKFKALPEV
jgi:Gly-Xaa carboxypeptidase